MNKIIKFFSLILFLNDVTVIQSQNTSFDLTLEAVNIVDLGGLQSFAFGQHDGKWLVLGGRLDGLHRRQPFATFDIAGHNTQLLVIDPVAGKKWAASMNALPNTIQEQLKSTNMEFYQRGNILYLIGGYGYSDIEGDHTTFSNLTAIDVPATINAIISKIDFVGYFRQIKDAQFQVSGGRLEKIGNTFYLVGGQKFIGRYNPMGPDHGPGFIQEYTNQIRKFLISDDGTNITVSHLPSITDEVNLHRRDYNVAPQIMPDGKEGITAFSGVFQQTIDLPFLNCVNIDSAGYLVNNDFTQYYNHYHCANFQIYSSESNEMNTIFFGGIAQFFDNSGTLTQDNNVPFVKTIARVSRDKNGIMAEYKLPVEMPSLLGAGSEFIPNDNIPRFNNGVFKFDELETDTIVIGYIYGGINSSEKNIFWINDGTQSVASSQIFKVKFNKNKSLSNHDLNEQSEGTLQLKVFPNPNDGFFTLKYNLIKPTNVNISLSNLEGKLIEKHSVMNQNSGENIFSNFISTFSVDNTFVLTVETDYEKITQRIIIAK